MVLSSFQRQTARIPISTSMTTTRMVPNVVLLRAITTVSVSPADRILHMTVFCPGHRLDIYPIMDRIFFFFQILIQV